MPGNGRGKGGSKLESLNTYRRLAESAGLQVHVAMDVSDAVFPTLAHWSHRLEENAEAVRALIGDVGVDHFRASCEILPLLWEQRFFGDGLVAAVRDF